MRDLDAIESVLIGAGGGKAPAPSSKAAAAASILDAIANLANAGVKAYEVRESGGDAQRQLAAQAAAAAAMQNMGPLPPQPQTSWLDRHTTAVVAGVGAVGIGLVLWVTLRNRK